jgi:hypothetical protein
MFSANPALGDGTALDRYVAAPDSSYRYTPTAIVPGDGYTALYIQCDHRRNESCCLDLILARSGRCRH